MKRSYNFTYHIAEGFRSIFTHGLMSFAAVFMIVSCLLIMGSFSLVAVNLESELGDLERENQFLAFVDESYTREQAQALEEKLKGVENVSTVTFISKETAKADFAAKHAEDNHAGLYADLPDETFRDRYSVHMDDISRLEETVAAVAAVEGIAGYQAAPEISEGLVLVRNVATAVAIILSVLLLIISLSIIYNTIRLGTFTRRDEVAIMKMVGATNGFVRAPFVVEGMILGLTGGLVAFFAQWGIYELIGRAIHTDRAIELITLIPFPSIAWPLLGVFSGAGLLVGTIGSVMALHKFLQV